jgi:UDP-apiose/xylose synthase
MPKLALLGCGGFIGSHCLDAFLAEPGPGGQAWEIQGWDFTPLKIRNHLGHPRFTFHEGDLYAHDLARGLADCDAVISLAAICNPSQYNTRAVDVIDSNFTQARKIADTCAALGKWLIQFSTSEVYGQTLAYWTRPGVASAQPGSVAAGATPSDRPELYELDEETSPLLLGPVSSLRWSYACAKQLLERYIMALHHEQGLAYTIVRPFNFFGTRMDFLPGRDGEGIPRVLACFTSALLERQPLALVDGGHARRTFLAVEEAAGALRLMLERPDRARNRVFNLGNPANETTIRDLAQMMREVAAEVTGDKSYGDTPLREVAAMDFYGPGYADSDRRLPRIDRARDLLGWTPALGLRDILRRSLRDAFSR